MPTFDGDTLRITLDALPSPNDGSQNVNVQDDLYEQWKLWAQLPGNLKYPIAFRTVGGDPLTPGVDAGAYFFLQNQDGWRIISSDEDQTINYSGNLVGEDSAVSLIVPTPGRTVLHLGLQPVTQRVDEILRDVQTNLFDNAVHIDTTGLGLPGTAFPLGTPSDPVDNLPDAVTIALREGIREFRFVGSLTLDSATTYPSSAIFRGSSTTANINFNSTDVQGMQFFRCGLFGVIAAPGSPSGLTLFEDCTLAGPIVGFAGTVVNSVLSSTLFLRSGVTQILNSASNASAINSPVIDAGGASNIDLVLRNYAGGVRLSNFTAGDSMATLGFHMGRLNIDASTTDFGVAEVRGIVEVNNESVVLVGPVSNGSPLPSPHVQFNTDGAIDGNDIALIKAFTAGRVQFRRESPDLGIILIDAYDDNGFLLRTLRLDETAGAETRTVV